MTTKTIHNFLLTLFILANCNAYLEAKGKYYKEFESFQKREDKKYIFDENAHQGLARIQADIDIRKELSFFQRLIRYAFLRKDVVIVTSDTMPQLYCYIDTMCKEQSIATPIIFLTRKKGFFDATARKLLMSVGAIVIGQEFLTAIFDNELEAIVAHEIGHIKYNHSNKNLCLWVLEKCLLHYLLFSYQRYALDQDQELAVFMRDIVRMGHEDNFLDLKARSAIFNKNMVVVCCALFCGIRVLKSLICNKCFEKEADLFACKMGKAEGIIDCFELLKVKEQAREDEFVRIADLLKQNKKDLSYFNNGVLHLRYYFAKTNHCLGKIYKWIYHHTPLGTHQSPQARIDAAKKYLAAQQ